MRIQRRTRVHRPPSGLGRSGFTLIECLVVVSILGVLAALILVAVQGARESGRRLQCLNNLKQIGLAFASYESTHRVYPSVQPRSRDRLANHFSPVARILSELDQRAVFHSLNFQVAQGHNEAAPDNRTAGRAVLGVFLCPSDGGTLVTFGGRCNIRVNQGASLGSFPQKYEPARSGPFQFEDWVSSASVRDGLSHTALASERLTGNGDLRSRDFTRNTRFAWMQERMSGVTTEALVVHCATPREEDFDPKGRPRGPKDAGGNR
jgi:prepilin-type N-terminal cleavage/methylation domain-containing protein